MVISNKKKVYDAIRQKLLVGELRPGTRLSEASMAKALGVSRTPVREAFNQLGRDGLVENLPHSGTYVKRLSREELSELFDLREMLEAYAARRAADRITEAELNDLRRNCLLMESINDEILRRKLADMEGEIGFRWKVCDVSFHSSLIAAAGSVRVSRIIRDFHILTNLCLGAARDKSIKLRDNLLRVVREHSAMVSALAKRDGEKAAKVMGVHIREGKRQSLSDYQPEDAEKPVLASEADSAIEKILSY